MHGHGAATILVTIVLAGCLAELPPAEGEAEVTPVATTFRGVLVSTEGIDVAALAWLPRDGNATSVVLAVHTVGGDKGTEWHNAPVADYSLAERVAADGRAFVSIDFLGYGESGGNPDTVTMNDLRVVVTQVANALRGGEHEISGVEGRAFDHVVGAGYSLGSLVVQMAQAEEAPFDGVVSLGWSASHANEEWVSCALGAVCDDPRHTLFHPPGTDPAVWEFINETHTSVNLPPFVETILLTHRIGSTGPSGQDAYASRLAGPILLVQGAEDWLWTDPEGDAERYGAGAEVTQLILPETGHFVLHHTSRIEAHEAIAAWADGIGV